MDVAREGLVPLTEVSVLLGGCDDCVIAPGPIPVVALSWDDCDEGGAGSVADGRFCFCPSSAQMGGEGDV